MAQIYVSLIRKGAICPKTGVAYTINDVPEKLRAAVQAILDEEA